MSEDGLDYDAVLEDAQERGYAERNPAEVMLETRGRIIGIPPPTLASNKKLT